MADRSCYKTDPHSRRIFRDVIYLRRRIFPTLLSPSLPSQRAERWGVKFLVFSGNLRLQQRSPVNTERHRVRTLVPLPCPGCGARTLCAVFAEQRIINMSSRVLVAWHSYSNQIYRTLGGWLSEKIHNDVKNLLKKLFLQFNKYLKYI